MEKASLLRTKCFCLHWIRKLGLISIFVVSLLAFIPQSEYKHSNDDLGKKYKAVKFGLISTQGKVLASLHNVLPAIFSSKDGDVLHPIPNLKKRQIMTSWWYY